MKLEFDGLLSYLAFKFNLRRYNLFAEKCLGRSAVPPLARDEVAKMGLAGLEGINAVDTGPSEAEQAAGAYIRPLFSST